MKTVFLPGKQIRAICRTCGCIEDATYGYGTITLDDGTEVESVMRALCDRCSSLVAVAQQSAPTLHAARTRRDEVKRRSRSTIRLPRVLVDFARMELHDEGGAPERFDLMVKAFLLAVMRARPARRERLIRALRDSDDSVLALPLDASVHLDLSERLWETLEALRAEASSSSASDLVRRMLVVMEGDRGTRQELHHLLLVTS